MKSWVNRKRIAKIYLPSKAAPRHEKVAAMVASGLHKKLNFAAMPIQLVVDDSGQFAGFSMQRVQQAYQIHQLYNRDDRLNLFPSADYRFLVRAAHNLAQAFTHLHYENIVIGDVNESGIFYSTGGWVKLIDCDSFQAELGNEFYPCLVKVPEYTPGELHGKDLSSVRRTPNHDNFALAVMVFRLLMLGQHPYTARYTGSGDSPTQGSRVETLSTPMTAVQQAKTTAHHRTRSRYQACLIQLLLLLRLRSALRDLLEGPPPPTGPLCCKTLISLWSVAE